MNEVILKEVEEFSKRNKLPPSSVADLKFLIQAAIEFQKIEDNKDKEPQEKEETMKKGIWEIEKTSYGDYIFEGKFYGEDTLRALSSLIDAVTLKIGDGYLTPTSSTQPLTEGEEFTCCGSDEPGLLHQKSSDMPCYKPQQESNKEGSKLDPWRKKYLVGTKEQAEELTRLGATDGVVHKFDEEEPSKKPSTRISEIRKNITSGGSFKVWYGNDSLTAIVEYLDELHERKVI